MKKQREEQAISTVKEFLVFTTIEGDVNINVHVANETVWLTQKLLALLYGVSVPTVNEHLKNIYADQEIVQTLTIRKFRIVQNESGREISREVEHYNLDAIIAVGYRVNS